MPKPHSALNDIFCLSLIALIVIYPTHIFAQNIESEPQNVQPKQLSQLVSDMEILDTALKLDGNNSFVEIKHSNILNSISGKLTVSAWIKPTHIPNRYANIIHKTDNWRDGITHRSFILNFKEGGSIQFAASPNSLNEASLYSLGSVYIFFRLL